MLELIVFPILLIFIFFTYIIYRITFYFTQIKCLSRIVIQGNNKLKKRDVIMNKREEKLTVNTIFFTNSSLPHKNTFIQSFDFEQNLAFIDNFYEREVA